MGEGVRRKEARDLGAWHGFSRTVFRGRKVLLAITIASIMVPPQILIVPLFRQMLAMNLIDTYAAIILPQTVAPMTVFILKKFFDGIPRELEDAARIGAVRPVHGGGGPRGPATADRLPVLPTPDRPLRRHHGTGRPVRTAAGRADWTVAS